MKWVAYAYSFRLTGALIRTNYYKMLEESFQGKFDSMADLHAVSSGNIDHKNKN